jgi:predicted ATP-binding protein involved in virulence
LPPLRHDSRWLDRTLTAIALIDEVDLHLHPVWQQHVLSDLTRTFRGTQFIVTTHSPQVLSTVKRECIRLLGTNTEGEQIVSMPVSNTYGQPSNFAMHQVMKVDPQPPIPELDRLRKLTRLVDQGEYEGQRVEEPMSELVIALGAHHEQIQRLRRSIQRQRLLAGDSE